MERISATAVSTSVAGDGGNRGRFGRVLGVIPRSPCVEGLAESVHNEKLLSGRNLSISVSDKADGAEKIRPLVDASPGFWLTTGSYISEFEKHIAEALSVRHALTTNCVSSTNLLALSSPLLHDEASRLGDGVVTVAAGFPAAVNPACRTIPYRSLFVRFAASVARITSEPSCRVSKLRRTTIYNSG